MRISIPSDLVKMNKNPAKLIFYQENHSEKIQIINKNNNKKKNPRGMIQCFNRKIFHKKFR